MGDEPEIHKLKDELHRLQLSQSHFLARAMRRRDHAKTEFDAMARVSYAGGAQLRRAGPTRQEDPMLRQVLVGVVAGFVFLILDGALNANPLAQRLYAAYQPIARPSVNVVAGSAIDLTYGVALVLLFVMLRASLPGHTNLTKALSFGVIVWFLRVFMRVAGEWVMTTLPAQVHAYTLVAGLVQLLIVAYIIAVLVPPSHPLETL